MLDVATLRDFVSGPGVDTRQWVSYGIVNDPGGGQSPVEFDESDYKQPFVEVTLQPSNVPVRCRVAQGVAGSGEGEWYPFIPGDEVLVILPQGDEKNACIIGRLSNSLDSFPKKVAGNTVNKNNFGFRRMVAPYLIETQGGFMVRHATTQAYISITSTGDVVIASGESAVLRLGADGQGLASSDGKSVIQIKDSSGDVLIQAGPAGSLPTDAADASAICVARKGPITVAASTQLQLTGNQSAPVQHNVSMEQMVTFVYQVLTFLQSTLGVGSPVTAASTLTAALPACAKPDPLLIPMMELALKTLATPPVEGVYNIGSRNVLVG